jgi:hypothetical protein
MAAVSPSPSRSTAAVSWRCIGTTLLVRVRSEVLEVYHATAHLLTIPRLLGTCQHRIDYRHVIWSLVRKPGAIAHYRFRDDLFPSLIFRRAYDALHAPGADHADRHYVRLLHLAASTLPQSKQGTAVRVGSVCSTALPASSGPSRCPNDVLRPTFPAHPPAARRRCTSMTRCVNSRRSGRAPATAVWH